MNPLVSIIIPTYNRAHLIEETIQSILGQTYQNWECIIVDDRSTDNTHITVREFVESDTRFHLYKRPEHVLKGANTCRNIGLNKAKGKYIQFFDSDDLMAVDKLEVHINKLNNGYDFCVSRYDSIRGNEQIQEKVFESNLKNTFEPSNYLLQKNYWGTINVSFNAQLLKNVEWDETLMSGQEYNFFCKLLVKEDVVGVFINKVLSYRRLHENSIQANQSKDDVLYNKNKLNCFYQTHKFFNGTSFTLESNYLLFQLIGSYSRVINDKRIRTIEKHVKNSLISQNKILAVIYFTLAIFMKTISDKGYLFFYLSRKNLYRDS